jgi:hypothetical protein
MDFSVVTTGIHSGIEKWETILHQLPDILISFRQNKQGRTIRQILGHMIDSASNNTHRIIHLQYQESPLIFPNYATNGNNDRWIDIQNYQQENWHNMVQLWKYSHLHLVHVINIVNPDKLDNEWIAGPQKTVILRDMITDYLRHFKLHLDEIRLLINEETV